MASMLIIRHPKTDEEYAVSAADFRKIYEPQGFKAVRHEDGEPYEPPKKTSADEKTTEKSEG